MGGTDSDPGRGAEPTPFNGLHSWEVLERVPPEVMTRAPRSWSKRTAPSSGEPAQRPAPVEPRPAASVALLRAEPEGLSVWLMRRSRQMKFGGVWAFPGGKVEPGDGDSGPQGRVGGSGQRDPDDLATLRRCAVRECQEETGLVLDPATLLPWARWITPDTAPYRFDTWFFLAPVAADADPHNDTDEADQAGWVDPVALVAADREAPDDQVSLLPPTRALLTELALLGTWERVVAAAQHREIAPVEPRMRIADGAFRVSHPQRDGSWS